MMLVALLMMVLVAMERARDPRNYRWLWGDAPAAAPRAAKPLADTSLTPRSPQRSPQDQPERTSQPRDPLHMAQRDAWQQLVQSLSEDERQLLSKILDRWRAVNDRPLESAERRPLPAAYDIDAARGNELLDQLDRGWSDYLARAESTLASRPAEQSSGQDWSQVIDQLRRDWTSAGLPTLRRLISAGDTPTTSQDKLPASAPILADLQRVLDDLALDRVRDNTAFQSGERTAWFRLLEQLDRGAAEELAGAREVSYLQLMDQPDVYRGQPVRFGGVARGGYRTEATANELGIDHYDVLWIKPHDGSNAPIAVYFLRLPAGFPQLAHRQKSGEITPLDEPVEVRGYFFKRLAYRSQQGVSIGPLVVAAEPQWVARPQAASGSLSSRELALAIGGGVLLGLLGLASSFYFVRSAVPRGPTAPDDAHVAQRLRELEVPESRP